MVLVSEGTFSESHETARLHLYHHLLKILAFFFFFFSIEEIFIIKPLKEAMYSADLAALI